MESLPNEVQVIDSGKVPQDPAKGYDIKTFPSKNPSSFSKIGPVVAALQLGTLAQYLTLLLIAATASGEWVPLLFATAQVVEFGEHS